MRSKLLATVAAAAMSIATMATAMAAPVVFDVTGGSFTTGSGYGKGNGQLDVAFTSLVTPQSFTLDQGQTQSFLFGRVTLGETCINSGNGLVDLALCGFSGLGSNETDNLGVTANLSFANPLAATIQSVAITGAFVGPVNDIFDDYFINFRPVTVNFGNGGEFVLDLGDLFFDRVGSITNGANITLTATPVPEPASLALFASGLLGLGLMRRSRSRSV